MEIYRSSVNSRVTVLAPETVVPVGGTIDITAVDNYGTLLHTFDEVIRTAEGFAIQIPWSLSRQDSEFFVKWKFDYVEGGKTSSVSETTDVKIITPILSLDELKKITGWTDEYDVVDLERRVRYAIQAYTLTTFGKFYGTIPVDGAGSNKLTLPIPLLEIETPTGMTLFGGGKYVGYAADAYYPGGIKSAPPEEVLDSFATSVAPIRAPYYQHSWFADDVVYNIKGVWGYNEVPEGVRQAARLLAADYACDESLWRDRYVQIMKSGDWTITFAGGAFLGTGNVSADQILDGYRRTNLVIV